MTAPELIISNKYYDHQVPEIILGTYEYRRRHLYSLIQIIPEAVREMDGYGCLVEYLDHTGNTIETKLALDRGNIQALAECIIGNGLAAGAKNLIIFRSRKPNEPSPGMRDRQLIGYLKSGLNILYISLLDYIIAGEGILYSARLAGSLNWNEHHAKGQQI